MPAAEELNPNHPVLQKMQNQWQKVAALLVQQITENHPSGTCDEVYISMAEIERMTGKAVSIQFTDTPPAGIYLRVMTMEEAERLAKLEGGLPH